VAGKFLIHWNKAIVCVSHDRYFLDRVCDKTYELTHHGLEKYQCRYSDYLVEKQERRERLEKDYKVQQNYLKQQQEFIDRFRYKATKASAVQSRIKMLEKMELIELPEEPGKDIRIKLDAGTKLCRSVMKLDNISIGPQEKPLFVQEGKIEVEWGDKVGIIGSNGMGKSTLLKSILGNMPLLKGKIVVDSRARAGYYAQAHENLDPENRYLTKWRQRPLKLMNGSGRCWARCYFHLTMWKKKDKVFVGRRAGARGAGRINPAKSEYATTGRADQSFGFAQQGSDHSGVQGV